MLSFSLFHFISLYFDLVWFKKPTKVSMKLLIIHLQRKLTLGKSFTFVLSVIGSASEQSKQQEESCEAVFQIAYSCVGGIDCREVDLRAFLPDYTVIIFSSRLLFIGRFFLFVSFQEPFRKA